MTAAQQLTDVITEHGEGPVWDARRGSLLLVDMLQGDLVELATGGAVTRRHIGSVLAVIRPRVAGGYIAGVERGFQLLDDDFAPVEAELPVFDDPAIRMNEGGCDPQGRFYCGTMAYDETPGAGTLYRLDPDRSVTPVLHEVTISNGLQWSADGATAYYNDTPTRAVAAFDFDAEQGALSNRRALAELPEGAGNPDGMAIDREGGLWIACWGGSAVRRYSPEGELTEVVEVAAPNVTSCTFGGADGGTLYITTSRQGGGESAAASGAVFAYEPGVTGAPPVAFAG